MDLSKLPKFSQTPPPADNAAPMTPAATGATPATPGTKVELYCRCGAPINPGTNFCSNCGANYYEATGGPRRAESPVGGGGMWIEAFLSIAVGAFLLFMAPTAIKYFGHQWFNWNTGPFIDPFTNLPVDYVTYTDGSRKLYRDLPNYWSDLAISSFAIVLILEGVVLALIRNRWIILTTALLTAIVTIGNLAYVVSTYSTMGFAPISTIAVIFGVLMSGYQFMMFKELSAGVARR